MKRTTRLQGQETTAKQEDLPAIFVFWKCFTRTTLSSSQLQMYRKNGGPWSTTTTTSPSGTSTTTTTRRRRRTTQVQRRLLRVLVMGLFVLGIQFPSVPTLPRVIVYAAPSSSSSSSSTASTTTTTTTRPIQIYETEYWDGERWKAVHRWTNKDGERSLPPDKITGHFVDEWQIVMTTTGQQQQTQQRDAYGWEYLYQGMDKYPLRQRIWIRNLREDNIKNHHRTDEARSRTSTLHTQRRTAGRPPSLRSSRKSSTHQAQQLLPRWYRNVRDDFNFKGCGWSFYKSLLERNSVGLAFRLPLTSNFDFFDRRPALPSISSSVCVFYPALAYILVSGSLRVEWIKWCLSQVLVMTQYSVIWLGWTFLRGILLAASALLFPITRTLVNPPCPVPFPQFTGPSYSRNIEERIGCSISWRMSPRRGYEFRVSYWHYYAPTMTSLWEVLNLKSTAPSWFARRAAVMALSTGGPTLDPPYIFCSLILGLSGYYFRTQSAESESMTTDDEVDDIVLQSARKIRLSS